jgi:hypothetical protein
MIFSLQRFVEDYLQHRGLRDVDQYAVKVSNLYARERRRKTNKLFLQTIRRIRTVFYRNNSQLDRPSFEKSLVSVLDNQFKKKLNLPIEEFPGGVTNEKREFRRRARLTIASIMVGFRRAVESRAIGSFWKSRATRNLRPAAEKIGQALFVMFTEGVLGDRGLTFREVFSGAGFIDFVVLLSRIPHLVELKVMRKCYEGATQLATYMDKEFRKEGWLVLFDARPQIQKTSIPSRTRVGTGTINNIVVDINPIPPSRIEAQRGS